MVINLKDIRLKGKTEEDFSFSYEPEKNLCDIPGVELVSPVKIDGVVSLIGRTAAFVEMTVNFTLKGDCTFCLSETTREYFIESEQEFSADNEYGYLLQRDSIDLTKLVVDEITLNMPMNFTCESGCEKPPKMEF